MRQSAWPARSPGCASSPSRPAGSARRGRRLHGHGHFSEIAQAAADTEIGSCIGSLPDGVSRTSIQADFYRCLRELKLEKYKALTAQPLELDLRENTRVKSEQSAFLDLNRSFFLHRLRVLGVRFGTVAASRAGPRHLGGKLDAAMDARSRDRACRIGPARRDNRAGGCLRLQGAAGSGPVHQRDRVYFGGRVFVAVCREPSRWPPEPCKGWPSTRPLCRKSRPPPESLSAAVRFGSIRRLDPAPLLPILSQLFLRACLILPGSCAATIGAAGLLAMRLVRSTPCCA